MDPDHTVVKLLAVEHDATRYVLCCISPGVKAHESWLCFSLVDLRQKHNDETLVAVGLCRYSFTLQLRNQLSGTLAFDEMWTYDWARARKLYRKQQGA
jgi:hypothetical protein